MRHLCNRIYVSRLKLSILENEYEGEREKERKRRETYLNFGVVCTCNIDTNVLEMTAFYKINMAPPSTTLLKSILGLKFEF